MVNNIADLLKLGSDALKECFQAWFGVLSAPAAFVASIDLGSKETLTKASVFAVFVSIVNLLIEGPLLRSLGVHMETPAYLLFDTVFTYAGFFVVGVLYHLAGKAVRGKGALIASVIVYLYLTAWKPIGALVAAPIGHYAASLWLEQPANQKFAMMFWETVAKEPALLANVGIYIAYVVCVLIWGARMFAVAHQIGPVRAAVLSILGYALGAVAVVVLLGPVQKAALLAFRAG